MVFDYYAISDLRFAFLKTLSLRVLQTNLIPAKNQGSLFTRYTKSVHTPSTPHSVYPLSLPVYIPHTDVWTDLEGTSPQFRMHSFHVPSSIPPVSHSIHEVY